MSNKQKRAERNEKAERAARLRREREREQQRRARIVVTAIVAVVVLIVVVAAVAIIPRLGDEGPSPEGVTSDNGILYTAADVPDSGSPTSGGSSSLEPVHVVLYEDFQCPACKTFEGSSGSYLDQQVSVGAIDVEYRPIAVLDGLSSTDYSTRSANAAACVFEDSAAATFVDFHNALYANQPPEGGAGLSDDELTQIAQTSGASDDVAPCISNGTFEDWSARATEAASKDGVFQTPTVRVNGEDVSGASGGTPGMEDLMAAITQARTGAG